LRLLPILALLFWQSPQPQIQHVGPNETFATARLSENEVRQVVSVVEASAYDTPESWLSELRVKRIDLAGTQGLAVQGSKLLCGATGNCQIWIFRKSGDHWKSLFGNDQTPVVEGFRLGPATRRGVPDLTVWSNTGAEAGRKAVYKFDGEKYRLVE
jgi:hypothetical protein